MNVCEQTSGLPCEEGDDLLLPEGEATIIGVTQPYDENEGTGTVIQYTDSEGETWDHMFTDPHQLIAIQDSEGNTALLIISDRLTYTSRGIRG